MKERTTPQNQPSQPQPPQKPTSVPGWQTVEFPNAISIDASQRQALYTQSLQNKQKISKSKSGSNSVQLASGRLPSKQSPQSIEALLKLIEDANQRNHELMNRVTQLEDALEQSRQALMAELEQDDTESTNTPESAETSQQVNYLLTQLEFSQQAHQRQEILVETLTGQLQSSQDRVNQLETSCNQLRETISAQTLQLNQYEVQCNDLQSRLERQQRYTLQFKAALEKCLEVPPPSYEIVSTGEELDVQAQQVPPPSDLSEKGKIVGDFISNDASNLAPDPETNPLTQAQSCGSETNNSEVTKTSQKESFENPPQLNEPFFPKVNHIKPWSVRSSDSDQLVPMKDGNDTDKPNPSQLIPQSDRELSAIEAIDTTGPFESNFHDTLLELANTEITQGNNESQSRQDIRSMTEQKTSDFTTEVDLPALPIHPNEDSKSDNTSNNHVSDNPPEHETVSESTEHLKSLKLLSDNQDVDPVSSVDVFRWRSHLPPNLRGNSQSESAIQSDELNSNPSHIYLPGESVSKPIASIQLVNGDASQTKRNSHAVQDSQLEDANTGSKTMPSPSEAGDGVESTDPTEVFWQTLAVLLQETTDDIVQAKETNDFSGFISPAPRQIQSLTEIFAEETPNTPDSSDSDIPLELCFQRDDEHPDAETTDFWKRMPGSYLNSSQIPDKISSIPPLSLTVSAAEDEKCSESKFIQASSGLATPGATLDVQNLDSSNKILSEKERLPHLTDTGHLNKDSTVENTLEESSDGNSVDVNHSEVSIKKLDLPGEKKLEVNSVTSELHTSAEQSHSEHPTDITFSHNDNKQTNQIPSSLSSLIFTSSSSQSYPSSYQKPRNVDHMTEKSAQINIHPLSSQKISGQSLDKREPSPLLKSDSSPNKQPQKNGGSLIDLPAFLK